MNRRLFLTGAGASTAYVASRGFSGRKLYAQSSGPDPNLINTATTNSAVATANCFSGVFSGNDWRSLMSIHTAMLSDVQAKGLDATFVQSAYSVTNLDPATIDMQQVTNIIQIYQPAFQLSDLQAYFAMVPQDQGSFLQALNQFQQAGLTGHLAGIVNRCRLMSIFADQAAGSDPGTGGLIQPKAPPHSGKYNCGSDAVASFAFGTAMVVLAIMAGPAGVLAMAFWGPLTFWGGVGAGMWSAGHVVNCGF